MSVTYESILADMLESVPDTVDKREGSIIYDALAPAAVEYMFMLEEMERIIQETYVDTASLDGLIKRCEERGITRKLANYSTVKGSFLPTALEIEVGARFNCNAVNFTVTEKVSAGVYKLSCETAGTSGNLSSGRLIPINNISGLVSANITECLVSAEDDETEDELRQRYYDSIDSVAFGGNKADYIEKVNDIEGVGGCKVNRAWNSDITPSSFVPPTGTAAWIESCGAGTAIKAWLNTCYLAASNNKLTVGGTVKVVIIASDFSNPVPSASLISEVQNEIDPPANAGEGVGLAPIGHVVTVEGVTGLTINVSIIVTLETGKTVSDVQTSIENAIAEYFKELAEAWSGESYLIARISKIEAGVLELPYILDVSGTTLNGTATNVTLTENQVPRKGTVTVTKAS